MSQKSDSLKPSSERLVRDIRRATRRHYSAEERLWEMTAAGTWLIEHLGTSVTGELYRLGAARTFSRR